MLALGSNAFGIKDQRLDFGIVSLQHSSSHLDANHPQDAVTSICAPAVCKPFMA
jgi:hypothetical protein